MNIEELIQRLRSWLATLPQLENEGQLHAEVMEKLKAINVSCKNKPSFPNPAGGVSQPDVLVTGVDPQLLIEIKINGDWRLASQAAWQLFQAAELLREGGTEVRKLAIFGGEISDPIMHRMLTELDIVSIEHGGRA